MIGYNEAKSLVLNPTGSDWALDIKEKVRGLFGELFVHLGLELGVVCFGGSPQNENINLIDRLGYDGEAGWDFDDIRFVYSAYNHGNMEAIGLYHYMDHMDESDRPIITLLWEIGKFCGIWYISVGVGGKHDINISEMARGVDVSFVGDKLEYRVMWRGWVCENGLSEEEDLGLVKKVVHLDGGADRLRYLVECEKARCLVPRVIGYEEYMLGRLGEMVEHRI